MTCLEGLTCDELFGGGPGACYEGPRDGQEEANPEDGGSDRNEMPPSEDDRGTEDDDRGTDGGRNDDRRDDGSSSDSGECYAPSSGSDRSAEASSGVDDDGRDSGYEGGGDGGYEEGTSGGRGGSSGGSGGGSGSSGGSGSTNQGTKRVGQSCECDDVVDDGSFVSCFGSNNDCRGDLVCAGFTDDMICVSDYEMNSCMERDVECDDTCKGWGYGTSTYATGCI